MIGGGIGGLCGHGSGGGIGMSRGSSKPLSQSAANAQWGPYRQTFRSANPTTSPQVASAWYIGTSLDNKNLDFLQTIVGHRGCSSNLISAGSLFGNRNPHGNESIALHDSMITLL